MMKMKLKTTAVAVALALSSPAAFALEGINFDPDGSGATFSETAIGSFDWGGANILARNCMSPPKLSTDGCTLLVQTKLSALLDPNGNSVDFNATKVEYTMRVRVLANAGAANKVTLGDPGSGVNFLDLNQADTLNNSTGAAGADGLPDLFGDTTSIFEIFYDTTPDSNHVTGLGFDDGTLILTGLVGIKSFGVLVGAGLSTPPTPLDSSTAQNGINANQKNVQSLTLTGSGNFQIDVRPGTDTVDGNFFKDPFNDMATLLRIDIDDNGRGSAPFTATEPSPLVHGLSPNYGGPAVTGAFTRENDFDCDGAADPCDLHLEGDPKSVFKHQVLPEPASVALLGLGLGLFGFSARKLRRRV